MRQVVVNRSKFSVRVLGMAGVLALAAYPAHAKPKPFAAPSGLSIDQMDIVAQTTEYDGHAHTYSVRGGVRITLRDMSVTCDQAVIYDTPKDDRVERIVFAGHVMARRGPGTFRGDKVTYYVAERRLLAEGGTHTRLLLPASGSPVTPLLQP